MGDGNGWGSNFQRFEGGLGSLLGDSKSHQQILHMGGQGAQGCHGSCWVSQGLSPRYINMSKGRESS